MRGRVLLTRGRSLHIILTSKKDTSASGFAAAHSARYSHCRSSCVRSGMGAKIRLESQALMCPTGSLKLDIVIDSHPQKGNRARQETECG